jgi:diguanylate cyclase (GGDEF)-like protein
MRVWAVNSPENFRHKYLLVEAERARCASRDWEALELYDAAAHEAKASGYLYNEGLAYECAARFLTGRKLPGLAAHFMTEARYTYQKWGATAKVAQIERDHGGLLSMLPPGVSHGNWSPAGSTMHATQEVSSTTDNLDLFSIVEASQSITSEIRLEDLLTKLMRIVMANAGADRSVLLTVQDGRWSLRAEARAGWTEVLIAPDVDVDAGPGADVPWGVVHYCARKRESVVLSNAGGNGFFAEDPYFNPASVKSVLCIPLLRSETVRGMLYLENSLVEGAFSPEHLKVIELLSSQIAISIENAEFYRGLEQLVEQRTRELAGVNAELREANRRLEVLSRIDGLTQIANRYAFDEFAAREWKRHQRSRSELALVLCDIDRFKDFNDTHGHVAGDECLRLVAQAMSQAVRRPGDFLARYGGEEFVMILSDTDLGGALAVVRSIQDRLGAVRPPTGGAGTADPVTLSFGMVHTIPGTEGVSDAVRAADRALYEAKARGRNCLVIQEGIGSGG